MTCSVLNVVHPKVPPPMVPPSLFLLFRDLLSFRIHSKNDAYVFVLGAPFLSIQGD